MNAETFYTRIFDSEGLPIFTKQCAHCETEHSKKKCPECGDDRFYKLHDESDYQQGAQQ